MEKIYKKNYLIFLDKKAIIKVNKYIIKRNKGKTTYRLYLEKYRLV